MNKTVFLLSLILVIAATTSAIYFANRQPNTPQTETPVLQTQRPNQNVTTYTSTPEGLTFKYKSGANGYTIQEPPTSPEANNPIKTIVLIPSEQKTQTNNQERLVPSEGPVTITINIFYNTQMRSPNIWAIENTNYSGYDQKRDQPQEAVVGGANAIKYTADSLYSMDNIIVAHADYIYVFSGMYLNQNDQIRSDFTQLINTVEFTQSAAQTSGKLNIDEVCNGALAYMTFPDGAAADKFVQDCKNGKHPEVIEQFKKDNNFPTSEL